MPSCGETSAKRRPVYREFVLSVGYNLSFTLSSLTQHFLRVCAFRPKRRLFTPQHPKQHRLPDHSHRHRHRHKERFTKYPRVCCCMDSSGHYSALSNIMSQRSQLFQSSQLPPPPNQLPSPGSLPSLSFARTTTLPPLSALSSARYPPPTYSHPSLSNTAATPLSSLSSSSTLPWPSHRTSSSRDEQISPPLQPHILFVYPLVSRSRCHLKHWTFMERGSPCPPWPPTRWPEHP